MEIKKQQNLYVDYLRNYKFSPANEEKKEKKKKKKNLSRMQWNRGEESFISKMIDDVHYSMLN